MNVQSIIVTVGDYVMIEPIAEGDKVKAEISHILFRPQVQFIQQQGLWWVDQSFSLTLHVNALHLMTCGRSSHTCELQQVRVFRI